MSTRSSISPSLSPSLQCETHLLENASTTALSHFIAFVSSLTNTSPETFPILLSRYGPPERVPLAYPEVTSHLTFTERVLTWNKYLLDDILADGTRCRYQLRTTLHPPQNDLDSIIDFAIGIRRNQLFADGNHRSGILAIFELLADQGKVLKNADPFELYLILSHRKCPRQCCLIDDGCRELVKAKLRKYLVRRIRQTNETGNSRRNAAESVKAIARWNTAMTESVSRIFRPNSNQDVLRRMKRGSPRRYRQMRRYIV